MIKDIYLFLNRPHENYLVAQLRTYLNNRNVDYTITYNHLNLKPGFSSTNQFKKIYKLIDNYRTGKELIDGFDKYMEKDSYIYLQFLLEKIEKIGSYDLYCFSTYDEYMFTHLLFACILKRKYPKARFLFGGIEIQVEPISRKFVDFLGFNYSIGDLESTVYDLIIGTSYKHSMVDLSKIEDPPYFFDFELNIKDMAFHSQNNTGNVLSTSRGCKNVCTFCASPASTKFREISYKTLASWFRHYNELNIDLFYINDSTFNRNGFEDFLDELIAMKNKIQLEFQMTLKNTTFEIIKKLRKVGIKQISFGLEGINPKVGSMIKKKMPSYEDVYRLIKCMKEEGFQQIQFFYIMNFPGHSDELFEEEMNFMTSLKDSFGEILHFELYNFFLTSGCYIWKNLEKYGIKPIPIGYIPEAEKYEDLKALLPHLISGYDFKENYYEHRIKILIDKLNGTRGIDNEKNSLFC